MHRTKDIFIYLKISCLIYYQRQILRVRVLKVKKILTPIFLSEIKEENELGPNFSGICLYLTKICYFFTLEC